MKKIIATLAIAAFAANANAGLKDGFKKATGDMKEAGEKIENSYKGTPNPVRPFAGTLTSPVGNTVQYVAEGLDIIAEEGVEAAVKAIMASGQCMTEAQHPGTVAGCAVKLGGDGVIVVWNTAGYSVANAVDFGGELLSDVAYIWRDAMDDLASLNIPVVTQGAQLISFVLDHTGKFVKVSFGTLATSVRGLTEGGAMAVANLVDVPVSLLNGDANRAGQSLGIAVGAAGCTAIDAILFPVYLINNLVGSERLATCMEQAKSDFVAIRNGTYQPKTPNYGGDNKP